VIEKNSHGSPGEILKEFAGEKEEFTITLKLFAVHIWLFKTSMLFIHLLVFLWIMLELGLFLLNFFSGFNLLTEHPVINSLGA
jgi:hypothetical protein